MAKELKKGTKKTETKKVAARKTTSKKAVRKTAVKKEEVIVKEKNQFAFIVYIFFMCLGVSLAMVAVTLKLASEFGTTNMIICIVLACVFVCLGYYLKKINE